MSLAPSSKRFFTLRFLILVACATFIAAPAAQSAEHVKTGSPGKSPVETIPAYNPHRVIVFDPDFPHLNATSAWFINGDTGKVVGMIGTGTQANLTFSPNHNRFYVAETFYSRLDHGKRTDVVTYYDTTNLSPIGETKLPKGRFMIVQKKYDAAATPDGRYVLSFNETPAMSVSVVDVKKKKYLDEIPSRGCWGVFPTAGDRFESICPNGSLLTVTFKPDGKGGVKAQAKQSKPFFDPKKDPVFDAPGFGHKNHKLMFVTTHGIVHPADVSGATPKYGKTWSLLTDADKSKGWRPGGWMPLAYSSKTERLYVLMHKGGKWTYKFPGSEVWVYDTKNHKRVQRIKLKEAAQSIAISPDDVQLYTLSDEKSTLSIYAAHKGKLQHEVDELGLTPNGLYTAKGQ